MSSTDHIEFELLKKEIADTYRITYPSCTIPMEDWKGQDIVNFQEELIKTVKGRISEKWFYTHIKSKGEKLPRIDMLNMLCQYAGYQDWRDFTTKKKGFTKEKNENDPEMISGNDSVADNSGAKPTIDKAKKPKNYIPIIWIFSIVLILLLLAFVFKKRTKTYRGCFLVNEYGLVTKNSTLEVHLLNENESPIPVFCGQDGCFEYKTINDKIRFVLASPYYKTDTITRFLRKERHEEYIKMKTNDYALMIHYFSTSKINDWKERRVQLQDMIATNAKIYQIYSDGSGMELYNKEEFINKLTMPLNSLKNIEIVETDYSGSQITLLRFMQLENTK